MNQLAPLSVAVPLLGAAVMAAAHPLLTRRTADLLSIAFALATAAMTLVLLVHVGRGISVYWFGGWHPRAGVAIGIAFAVTAIGAGLAGFVALLMVLALVYSVRAVEVEPPYYHVLMLTFMAAMVGFCLSGDLFNMFVFFELMSVAAVALIAYKIEQQAALEGGLNFAVITSIGSFLLLLGIGLVYADTGALNLAQIGRALQHTGNDRVVAAAFTLLLSGLLIKAAVVPFHFWLDDAYAVALTPVCLLLAAAMSEMGLYGLARIWYGAFGAALGPHAGVVRAILVGAGLLTALWGAAMALNEDHLKRMLAFITIAFVGIFLAGVGLLTEDGLAGAAVYVLADGFGKATLFACVGIVQHRLGTVGQRRLHRRGRHLPATGVIFTAAGLLSASLPPFGPFLGKSMIEDAAIKVGYGFVPPLVVVASGLCAAAILRAAARVFLGWGDLDGMQSGTQDSADDATEPENSTGGDRTPAVMFIPTLLLLVGAAGIGVWFGFADLAANGAHLFVDGSTYRAAAYGAVTHVGAVSSSSPEWYDWLYGGAATLLAVAVAAVGLWGRRLGVGRLLDGAKVAIRPLSPVHTGRIGDYTAALTLGVGLLGVLMALTLR